MNDQKEQTGSELPISTTGLVSLALVARFLGLAAEPAQMRHDYGLHDNQLEPNELLRVAGRIGLKAKKIRSSWSKLPKLPLPAIFIDAHGQYAVLVRVDDDKVLVQYPAASGVKALSRDEFVPDWSGRLILLALKKGVGNPNKQFGFRWFLPAIFKYRRLLGEVFLASFFIQLFALLTPLFFQVVIDKVLVHKGLTTLDVLAMGLLGMALFEVVLGGLRTYIFSHTANRIDVELGAKLFGHLTALPLAYFQSRRVGDSVARVRELENIRNFLTGSSLTLVIDLFFTTVFLAVMYFYSPILCFIVMGALPFYVLLSLFVTPVLRARLNEKFNRGADNQAFLVETVTGIETIKSMAVEPQWQRRWENQLAGYVSAAFKATNLGNIANQSASFINKVTTVLILWVGAKLVMEGDLTVGQLVAFNMLAGRVSGPVLRLVQLWQDFQQAGISVKRLGDILNVRKESALQGQRSALPGVKGQVEFHRVTFRYRPDRAEAIKNFSLDIKPGEVIGIVGRSGSGKSTLAKLLQRLYVPESGRILVDGIDLSVVEPGWLRRQIGVVQQESFLFDRSIRENIALNDPGMSMEKVMQAAQLAGAHEFIVELPEGYDTVVGEHGTSLSGGQRQRIAIARALVSNPRVLIFDEATSALDYESEAIIQKNMQAICRGRTVLIIAHRLSAVRVANRIIVVDCGELLEVGTHKALLESGGYYARLHAIQTESLTDSPDSQMVIT